MAEITLSAPFPPQNRCAGRPFGCGLGKKPKAFFLPVFASSARLNRPNVTRMDDAVVNERPSVLVLSKEVWIAEHHAAHFDSQADELPFPRRGPKGDSPIEKTPRTIRA